MPEYIDRGLLRRAMRGVWADPDCPKDIADYIMHIVDLLPAEKATKVVRCEDCIRWDKRTTKLWADAYDKIENPHMNKEDDT